MESSGLCRYAFYPLEKEMKLTPKEKARRERLVNDIQEWKKILANLKQDPKPNLEAQEIATDTLKYLKDMLKKGQ